MNYSFLYDRLYSYSYYVRFLRTIYRLLLRTVVKGKLVLDVGCGTGESAALLKKLGAEVVAVDPNKEMLKIAKKKYPWLEVIHASFEDLQKINRKFDAVTAIFGPLAHVENVEIAFRNVYAVLKPGGIFAFDVFPRFSWTRLRKFGKNVPKMITFRKVIKKQRIKVRLVLHETREIEQCLKTTGFYVVKKCSLFNYIAPVYSAPRTSLRDICKCWTDFLLGKLLRNSRGNLIIYLAKKI
ncbi:MAG: class I SAM-dependent methyltransferase [bacterium]|nr:class I SAM-dependent methyltransferase [bacterium]